MSVSQNTAKRIGGRLLKVAFSLLGDGVGIEIQVF